MTVACRVGITLTGTKIEEEHHALVDALGTGILDEARFDARAYPETALVQARAFWRARMASEHRSVPVFTQLALQLYESNAPLDAMTVMLRMAQDELRHAEICGRMLRALGAEAVIDADITVHALATHAGTSLEERALRNVIYTTSLSEMIAVARLVDSLERASDPFARAAIRSIVADEVMHGQFGFLYLDAMEEWLSRHDAVRDGLCEYLRHAFAVLERELAAPEMARAASPPKGATALGVIDPARAHDIFHATVETAIVPGLEQRGIGARGAWRSRALAR